MWPACSNRTSPWIYLRRRPVTQRNKRTPQLAMLQPRHGVLLANHSAHSLRSPPFAFHLVTLRAQTLCTLPPQTKVVAPTGPPPPEAGKEAANVLGLLVRTAATFTNWVWGQLRCGQADSAEGKSVDWSQVEQEPTWEQYW